ncbi:MAG: hypothetical protein K2K02_06840 [Ruminococcus sp.]|nr:hypothetical protein [Ruminococcus sp.]
MISTGRISRTKTVNTEELLQKMQEIYAENELSVFLKKLESVYMESLKNLKYANARNSYLKSVIAEFTMKYTSEIKTQQHDKTEHSEPVKPLSFREMLKEMQYPDKYYMDSEIFDDEDSYYDYFGDDDEEERKMCMIPDSFRNSQETMERALKFLGRYYWIFADHEDYRKFADETYRTLARIICTGKVGRNRTVPTGLLIRRLNEINSDKHENDDSIDDFMHSFRKHLEDKLTEYSDISNKKAYTEAMLVSFLDGEYQENNIRAEMLLNQFTKRRKETEPYRQEVYNCAEDTARVTDTKSAEESVETETAMEEIAVEETKPEYVENVLAVEEIIQPESLADGTTDTIETAPEAEETTEPKEKWTKEYAEQVVKNLFGEDISEERLNYFTKGMYDEEPNTSKTEEVIAVTEDATALEVKETTESVCPADKHENQKSCAVSENGDFNVTNEMRNRVINALLGENITCA